MNQYAAKIGMTGTHFVNASGLPDPNHYSTAGDIALLSRAVIHDFLEDYKIYSIKEFERNGIAQHNRNSLLWRDASVGRHQDWLHQGRAGLPPGHVGQARRPAPDRGGHAARPAKNNVPTTTSRC